MNRRLRISATVSVLLFLSCKGNGDKANSKPPLKSQNEAQLAKPPATTPIENAAPPKEPLPEAPIPPAMSAPSQTAYFARGKTLLELQSDGTSKELGVFGPVVWCEVDSVANVVWAHGENGVMAHDLNDNALHNIVAGKDIESVEIRFTAGESIGDADGILTSTALIVTVGEAPSVKGEVICYGDRVHYCYDNMEDEDESKWVLAQDTKDALAAYNAFTLVDADFLKVVSSRSKSRALVKEPVLKVPKKPELNISPKGCKADPESCGELSYVGGQRFWTVVTENDRGDFYSEGTQLYDSKTQEFVDFGENARRAKPFEFASGTDLIVSPNGLFALTMGGKLLHLGKAEVIAELGKDALPCGWR